MNQPFYNIKFSSTSCNFEIRINDIPIFSYVDTGMISTQYPINHLMLTTGNQVISMTLWPQNGQQNLTEHSKLNISITVNDTSEPSKNSMEVYVLNTPSFDGQLPVFNTKGEFRAEIPYVLKGWEESTPLKLNNALTEAVFSFYNKVYGILEVKNFDAYKAIYTTKLKEIDTALYSSAKETDSEWEDLTAYLSDADMQVVPIPKNSKPMLYGNGKVVSLQQPNLEPALFFENKAEKTQYQVPLFLHKPKNVDSFEVIR